MQVFCWQNKERSESKSIFRNLYISIRKGVLVFKKKVGSTSNTLTTRKDCDLKVIRMKAREIELEVRNFADVQIASLNCPKERNINRTS